MVRGIHCQRALFDQGHMSEYRQRRCLVKDRSISVQRARYNLGRVLIMPEDRNV